MDVASPLATVSCVIATHNRRMLLPRVLDPLLSDPAAAEAIVVADSCSDGTEAYLSELARREPKLRWEAVQFGDAGNTRQRGAELASAPLLLILDDDTIPMPRLPSAHAAIHDGSDDLLLLGAVPMPDQLARRSVWNWDYAQGWLYDADRWLRSPDEILDHFRAGHFSISRVTALQIGLASPASYHEDFEFGLRCRQAGLRAAYRPELRAEHHLDRTAADFIRDARRAGRSHVALHRGDPDRFPPFDIRSYVRDTSLPLRPLIRHAARRRLRALMQPLLIICSRALFRLGLRKPARVLAWTLRRQTFAAAALEAGAEDGPG